MQTAPWFLIIPVPPSPLAGVVGALSSKLLGRHDRSSAVLFAGSERTGTTPVIQRPSSDYWLKLHPVQKYTDEVAGPAGFESPTTDLEGTLSNRKAVRRQNQCPSSEISVEPIVNSRRERAKITAYFDSITIFSQWVEHLA